MTDFELVSSMLKRKNSLTRDGYYRAENSSGNDVLKYIDYKTSSGFVRLVFDYEGEFLSMDAFEKDPNEI